MLGSFSRITQAAFLLGEVVEKLLHKSAGSLVLELLFGRAEHLLQDWDELGGELQYGGLGHGICKGV